MKLLEELCFPIQILTVFAKDNSSNSLRHECIGLKVFAFVRFDSHRSHLCKTRCLDRLGWGLELAKYSRSILCLIKPAHSESGTAKVHSLNQWDLFRVHSHLVPGRFEPRTRSSWLPLDHAKQLNHHHHLSTHRVYSTYYLAFSVLFNEKPLDCEGIY